MKKLNRHKKQYFILILFLFVIFYAFPDAFSEGEKLFKANKPEQAIPFFEQAILSETVSPSVYNFLGLSYYQVGKYQQSLDSFIKGTSKDGTNKRILYYNAGNTAFAMGNYSLADQYFSIAYAADNNFSSALLNHFSTVKDFLDFLPVRFRYDYSRLLSILSNHFSARKDFPYYLHSTFPHDYSEFLPVLSNYFQ